MSLLEKRPDPNQPSVYAPRGEEGDVAEVEQAGVADDDVETEREHHVLGHLEDRVDVHPEEVDEEELERRAAIRRVEREGGRRAG